MAWTTQAGNPAAQRLIADYPTPRALRQALANAEWTSILDATLLSLPWGNSTVGDVLASVDFQPRDVATLHSILVRAAQDVQVWVAPDGSQTSRPL